MRSKSIWFRAAEDVDQYYLATQNLVGCCLALDHLEGKIASEARSVFENWFYPQCEIYLKYRGLGSWAWSFYSLSTSNEKIVNARVLALLIMDMLDKDGQLTPRSTK